MRSGRFLKRKTPRCKFVFIDDDVCRMVKHAYSLTSLHGSLFRQLFGGMDGSMSMSLSMSMSMPIPSDMPSDMPSDHPSDAPSMVPTFVFDIDQEVTGDSATASEATAPSQTSKQATTTSSVDKAGLGAGTTAMIAVLSVAGLMVIAAVAARKLHKGNRSSSSVGELSALSPPPTMN
jgi:hypothetical protein